MNTTDFSDAWPKYDGDYSKLYGNLKFAFNQQESEVNHHNATSLSESPCIVSTEAV